MKRRRGTSHRTTRFPVEWTLCGLFVMSAMSFHCAPPDRDEVQHESSIASRAGSVVYDTDDRVDITPGTEIFELASRSVVALIPRAHLRRIRTGYVVDAEALFNTVDLCPGEPFADQPSAAFCTGVLVGADLVLTAGHCLQYAYGCDSASAFVFGYLSSPGDAIEVPTAHVFGCREIVVLRNDGWGTRPKFDYALLKLDRNVDSPLHPISLASPRDLALEPQELVVIGASQGTPLKARTVVEGIEFHASGSDLLMPSDTFHGDSGAPVLTPSGALVAIVSDGQPDYIFDTDSECWTVGSGNTSLQTEHATTVAGICDGRQEEWCIEHASSTSEPTPTQCNLNGPEPSPRKIDTETQLSSKAHVRFTELCQHRVLKEDQTNPCNAPLFLVVKSCKVCPARASSRSSAAT